MFWNETREDILNNITNYIRHGAYPFCAEPAFLREMEDFVEPDRCELEKLMHKSGINCVAYLYNHGVDAQKSGLNKRVHNGALISKIASRLGTYAPQFMKNVGLDKSDFEADCNLLAEFAEWQELIPQADLPITPDEVKKFSIDFMPFLGKNMTFAVHYHPNEVDKDKTAQLRLEFGDFKIVNTLTNGSEVEISPADMGLTPVNVWTADLENASIDETNLKKNQGFYDESGNLIESAMWYGSVNNNTEGMWILNQISTNNAFFIHSTAKEKSLHPSWLVSDYLVVNKTTPDTGTPIKNIANRLGEYEYTYTEPGTYKAVFVLNNANYKDEDSRIITMLINVK